MSKFRKKPIIIKATRWFTYGDHPDVYDEGTGNIGWLREIDGDWISSTAVHPGDWIVTGVSGKHYPCKPDIFEKTYEPVGEN